MDMSWGWDLDRRGSLVSGIGQGNHDSRYSLTMINIVTSSYKLSLECHAFISVALYTFLSGDISISMRQIKILLFQCIIND